MLTVHGRVDRMLKMAEQVVRHMKRCRTNKRGMSGGVLVYLSVFRDIVERR